MKITKEQGIIGIGYLLFMAIFYGIGATSARLLDFVAVVALTLFYAAIVYFVKKLKKLLAG